MTPEETRLATIYDCVEVVMGQLDNLGGIWDTAIYKAARAVKALAKQQESKPSPAEK